MKVAVITYHKNLKQYPEAWIDKFKQSILNQTFQDFDILEMDYGEKDEKIFDKGFYLSVHQETFADAMNTLLVICKNREYDYVFNTNVDDWYSVDRFENQIDYATQGFDIVSSNFTLVNNDEEYLQHEFHELDIKEELSKDHNILCHPVICYSKRFMENNLYNAWEIPYEDMKLWQRTIDKFNFIILEDNLCFHRTDKHL